MPKPHEIIDILELPKLQPTGRVKPILDAIDDGDWLSVFAIWLYKRTDNGVFVLFQERTKRATVAPGKLDVSAAGHYNAGETGLDGLRELQEELGIMPELTDCHSFGRHINSYLDTSGRTRRAVLSTYVCEFKGQDTDFVLDEREVPAVYWVPLQEFLNLYHDKQATIAIDGFDHTGNPQQRQVTIDDFLYNVDDYHFRNAERLYLYLKEGWLE
jgi:isopentenyldiphosphate isomerase